jgi:NDP-sugar pyrophosphorylase family protein
MGGTYNTHTGAEKCAKNAKQTNIILARNYLKEDFKKKIKKQKKSKSVTWVQEPTIPTERPPLVG